LLYRPAFIGLLLGLAIITGVLLIPENRDFLLRLENGEESTLPPRLFPMFPDQEEGRARMRLPSEALVKIERTPLKKEIAAGSTVRFMISVKNVSDMELQNLRIEERFDDTVFSVQKVEEGVLGENMIVWKIPALKSGERKSESYTVHIAPETLPQVMEATAFVRGEAIEESLSSSRMVTSVLDIVLTPKTGADLY
jgi:hypothetical protein